MTLNDFAPAGWMEASALPEPGTPLGSATPAVVRPVDTLIRNGWVVTVDRQRRVFTNGYVAFDQGRIVEVGPMAECRLQGRVTIDASGRLVMPGMANAHNHLINNAFRGHNDDSWPLLDTQVAAQALTTRIFTLADRLDAERTHALVRLHALEMLKAGYTATHDEHVLNVRKDSVEGAWAAIAESGMRGYLCRSIVDAGVPARGRESVDAGLAEVERLAARFRSDRLAVATGFRSFDHRAVAEDMARIQDGARAIGVPFAIDMTDNSRGLALARRGFVGGQVDYYRSFGLLDHGPIYVGKAVNLRAHEYAVLAVRDCRVALVPMLRFLDGLGLPVHDFLEHGMLPALGTDAPLVSDCQNPFEVMRMALLAQNVNVKARKAAPPAPHLWLNAERLIEMATLGGARALFMDADAGSLAVGKSADCVIVDMQRPGLQPHFEGRRAPGALVWGGQASDVAMVFVAGECLIENGRSTRWDEEQVVREAAAALDAAARECDFATLLPPRRSENLYRGWHYV